MNPTLALFLAIGILVVLGATFVISFIAYRRTPVPKGCEDLLANKKKCDGCQEAHCPFAEALGKKEGE